MISLAFDVDGYSQTFKATATEFVPSFDFVVRKLGESYYVLQDLKGYQIGTPLSRAGALVCVEHLISSDKGE